MFYGAESTEEIPQRPKIYERAMYRRYGVSGGTKSPRHACGLRLTGSTRQLGLKGQVPSCTDHYTHTHTLPTPHPHICFPRRLQTTEAKDKFDGNNIMNWRSRKQCINEQLWSQLRPQPLQNFRFRRWDKLPRSHSCSVGNLVGTLLSSYF